MNALFTTMVNTREFNYPPGGEQLMNLLDVLGPLDKEGLMKTLVKIGASGDEYKAGLTVKTLKRYDLIMERNGYVYMSARSPNPHPDANLFLEIFTRFAVGETIVHRRNQPAIFSISSNIVNGTVYEVALFDDTKVIDAAEYVEYKKLSKITKPVIVLKQNIREIGPDDVRKIFEEKTEIIIIAVNEGCAPIYFEDGKKAK